MQQSTRIKLTRSYPGLVLSAHRFRAAVTGKPYFFNRQKLRLQVFQEIDANIAFDNYIETGTYLGLTTHFLAETARTRGAHVHSCEINDDFITIAGKIVGKSDNVRLHHGNSVDMLRTLSPSVAEATNFVYLDAHVGVEYLPLREELEIIREWPNTIVMIDDFKVPNDGQFRWDQYDEEREISLRYIEGSFGSGSVYFPSYRALEERLAVARGYCVISMSKRFTKVLDEIPLLERHE